MSTGKPQGTDTLVGARGVDALSFILAYKGRGSTFICVIKAARTCVSRRTRTRVPLYLSISRQRGTLSTVATGT